MVNQINPILAKACSIALKIERPVARCQALAGIAETWLLTGNKPQGLEVIADALKVSDLLKHPDEKAKQLTWLARLLKEAGEESNAAGQFKRAYYLARAAESVSQKVNALYCLASEYLDAGLNDESKAILIELEQIVLDPVSQVDTICELINIAEIYSDMDEFADASNSLLKAVQSARFLKDSWFKAERLIEIAELFNHTGYLSEATGLIQEALNEVEKIDECSRPYFWMKLAALYVELDLKTRAADCLYKAREDILRSDDLNSAAGYILELAESYFNLEEPDIGLSLIEKAQTLIGDLPDVQDRTMRILESANLYFRLGEKVKAHDSIEKLYQTSISMADNKARLYTLGKLAILYLNLQNIKRASALVDEIDRIVTDSQTKTSGLGAIAEELVAAGNIDLALNLVEIIREAEIKTRVLVAVAKKLNENQAR